MSRRGFIALLLTLVGTSALAEESLTLSVVGPGQAGPEKLCVIGQEDGAFWAIEQIASNSFPAPKVGLEPFEGREERFVDIVAMMDGALADIPGWQAEPPEAPYVQLALVRDQSDGEARRDRYLPGGAVPPLIEALFSELRRYGMDCLPPLIR
jgi:hypothetical protein